MKLGYIHDSIPDEMISHGVKLSSLILGSSGSVAEQFIIGNYLPFDTKTRAVGVLGKVIGRDKEDGTYTFDVVIPQTYVVLTETGQLAGELDGKPYTGPIWLAAGKHQFHRTSGGGRVAIFLNDAYAKGFTPLYNIAEEVAKTFGTAPEGKRNGAELQ